MSIPVASTKLDRRDMQAGLATMALPAGYRFDFGGEQEDFVETVGFMSEWLALAVVFIYLILASQFGSFLQPLAIMLSLPLLLIDVMLGLALTRGTLNIMSMIGIIMLMGLVTKNAPESPSATGPMPARSLES